MNIDRKKRTGLLVILLLLWGCGTDPFPGAPNRTGASDVPFVPTYAFNFRTGLGPLFGAEANLTIFSQSDLLNLISAANVIQQPGTGVVTGVVESVTGNPAASVVLMLTDADGNKVGDIFYNSLGGVPNFVQTSGTDSSGAFTIFNVPPGEVYLKAIQGGRGNTRLIVFPDSVSLTNFVVFPVIPARIGVVVGVLEAGNEIPADPIGVSTMGIIADEDGDGVLNPNDFCPGTAPLEPVDLQGCSDQQSPTSPLDIGLLGATNINGNLQFTLSSESNFLLRLFDDEIDHLDTYNEITTVGAQIVQTQAPQLTFFPNILQKEDLALFAQRAGVSIGPTPENSGLLGGRAVIMGTVFQPDGSPRFDAVVNITNKNGQRIEELGATRIFYFDSQGHPDPTLTKTGFNGQYIAFNVPIEPLFITATADIFGSGTFERYSAASAVVPFPNSVFVKILLLQQIPIPNPLAPNIPPRFSVGVSGKVTEADEVTPVPGVRVTITGNKAGPFVTDQNGAYSIPPSLDPAATGPALAFGAYLLRVNHPNYLDTYNEVALGVTTEATPPKDLLLYSNFVLDQYIPERNRNLGVITGRIVRRRDGRAAAGISIEARDPSARQLLPVLYFNDDDELPNPALTQTTRNGRYMVYNAPPGLVFMNVISQDDTGNSMTISLASSVTVKDLVVNDAPPPSIRASGLVRDLLNAPVGGVTLKALGGDPIQDTRNNIQYFSSASDATGRFVAEMSPLNEMFIKASKDSSFYPTYNFGRRTRATDMQGFDLVIASRSQIGSLLSASALSIQQDPLKGIIIGEALDQGFGDPIQYCSRADGSIPPACTEGQPVAAVSGFFNEDTFLDLAVLNRQIGPESPGRLTIFFGNGNGGFRKSAEYPVGQGPTALALGNFNGDGNADLVVVNSNSESSSLSIFLGSRNGRFPSTPIEIPAGVPGLTSVGVGDANGDTIQDLFLANRDANSVSIFLGDGLGRFSLRDPYPDPIPLPPGCGPSRIALAPLDNDTLPDWVIACERGDRIELAVSNFGNSLFQTAPIPLVAPQALALADFNRDGGVDIIVTGSGPADSGVNGMLAVIMSNATFQNPPPENFVRNFEAPPTSVAVGDFNGDSLLDLAVTVPVADPSSPNVLVFLGGGSGTFLDPPFSTQIGISPGGIVVGDLDSSASDDLVLLDSAQHQVDVLLSIQVPANADSGTGRIYKVEAVDLSGTPIGQVYYLTSEGILTADHTRSTGRFMIFNVPPGIVFVKAAEGAVGNKMISVHPDSVSFVRFSILPGLFTTVPVLGLTLDAVARPIGDVDISFLGSGQVAFSSPLFLQGNSVVGGADYTLFLDAFSEFIIKMTKVGTGGLPPVPGDFDFDSIPDNVDDCPGVFNPDQTDTDGDNIGDACDPTPIRDTDGDGIQDVNDNCINVPNPDQLDTDLDGIGDACDTF